MSLGERHKTHLKIICIGIGLSKMFQCFLFFIGSGLNDGQWHEVRFLAKENFAVLTIDGDEASAVRTNSPLQVKTGEKYFFGGKKKYQNKYLLKVLLSFNLHGG